MWSGKWPPYLVVNVQNVQEKHKVMWHVHPSLQLINLLTSVWEGWINKVLIFWEALLPTASWRGGAEPGKRLFESLCSYMSVHGPGTDLQELCTGVSHWSRGRFSQMLWDVPSRRGHSWHLAFCSSLSFSSDIVAKEICPRGSVRVLLLLSWLVVEGVKEVEEGGEVERLDVEEEVNLRGTGVGGIIAFLGAFFSSCGSGTTDKFSFSFSSSSGSSFR